MKRQDQPIPKEFFFKSDNQEVETTAVVSHLQIQAGDGSVFSFPAHLANLSRTDQKYFKFQWKVISSDPSH